MEIDKLLIVAHPDDDILWGGANLLLQPGWMVIVASHNRNGRRGEFYKTMSNAGVYKALMYDVKDIYTEAVDFSDKLFKNTRFEKALRKLSQKQWKLVLTHNKQGEYGHEHHKSVGKLVKKIFPNVKVFAIDKMLAPNILIQKKKLNKWYAQTQHICSLIYDGKINKVTPKARQFYLKEKIYVIPTKPIITPIFHQIWFGSKPSKFKKYLMNNVKKNCGVHYKCWLQKDLHFKNFPLTWDYIQKSLQQMKKTGISRWAQVADLARYEIIYRYGGVYLDSNFEISPKLWPSILNIKGTFVGANEDPCGLRCKSNKYYLSNGFFAAIPRHPVLTRLVSTEFLNDINFNSKYINQETGPYALRKAIIHPRKEHVRLLPTYKIYPFMVNDSSYRKGQNNKCLIKPDKTCISINKHVCLRKNCLEKYYPSALAVYQSGLGGSWSW